MSVVEKDECDAGLEDVVVGCGMEKGIRLHLPRFLFSDHCESLFKEPLLVSLPLRSILVSWSLVFGVTSYK